MPLTYEFKAKTNQLKQIEEVLLTYNPRYIGIDNQKDTYFHVPEGRLKLREGNIENALIHYFREDHAHSKKSRVLLYYAHSTEKLKEILITALGIKVIIEKTRKIYYIDNVKFHLDEVDALGSFVEVEAIANEDSANLSQMKEQCLLYAGLFNIRDEDYIAGSYSDLLMKS